MSPGFQTISPVDGRVYLERPFHALTEAASRFEAASAAAQSWRATPLSERIGALGRMVDAFVAKKDEVALELTWQMGRPIRYAPGEVRGFEERARTMLALAPDALADIDVGAKAGFHRWIRREPLGVVMVLSPWNYPYLTAVNAVIPALAAGNVVLLKHSEQTPRCAERLVEAAREAGLPDGVFQYLHLSNEQVGQVLRDPAFPLHYVAFTGSVAGGRAVQAAAATRLLGVGLELGGKDPAYVRPDAPWQHTVENVVDGVFFNSGQSCCAVERVYVHEAVYDRFVDDAVSLVAQYRLGDPLDPETTLGPLVRTANADRVRAAVAAAVASGARPLLDARYFPAAREGTPYVAPQVLVDVTHEMEIMREETFGPVMGIQKVKDDDEAVRLMNDSAYGLTASVWTGDEAAAIAIGDRLQTGTVFMNRCDYLDPALAWVGVKHSGRGCTLSRVGYEQLTRPKSFHLRVAV